MKATFLIALTSVALGALCGAFAPVEPQEPLPGRVEEAPEDHAPAALDPELPPEPARAPDPGVQAALEAELSDLRRDPRTWSDAEIEAKRKELNEALAREKDKDLGTLLARVHELAALGPAGWADAVKALQDAAGRLSGADGRLDELLDACDGPVLDAMRWALTAPSMREDDAARTLAVRILARHAGDDDRIGPLLLEALAKEASPAVATLLAGAIPGASARAVVPELAGTLPADRSEYPEALMAYMEALRRSGWTDDEKQHALAGLADHRSEAIAEAAKATQAALAAQGTGVAIDWVEPDARDAFGLRPGDVVRSVDGEVPTSDEHLWILLSKYGTGTNGTLTVWRDGAEFQFGWLGRRGDRRRFSGFPVDSGR